MRKSDIRTSAYFKSMEIIPSYEVVGFYEKAAPIYVVKLKCEITSADRLPIIHDTLLRLLHQKMDIEEIPKFLGLSDTPEIVTKAWAELASAEIIHHRTNELTDSGRLYLSENKLEMNKRIYFTIEIDGITNEYEKNKNRFINSKNLAGQRIDELRVNIPQPIIQHLEKRKIREIFEATLKGDLEEKNQKLSDVLSIENININYRRVYCVVLKKGPDDIRVVSFDKNNYMPEYDRPLEADINSENTLANVSINDYLQDNQIRILNKVELSLEKVVDKQFIKDAYDNLIFESKRSIKIVVPIMSFSMLKDDMIETLVNKSNMGINVDLYLSGQLKNVDSFQQRQIAKLASIKKDNFQINHIPKYMENVVFIDGYKGILIDYKKVPLSNSQDHYIIDERGAEISQKEFSLVENEISQILNSSDDDTFKYTSKDQLQSDIKDIIDSLYAIDTVLRNKYGSFLRQTDSEDFSEVENVLKSSLAKNESSFKNFSSNLNKLLFEPIQNKNRIFFSEIKSSYPKLFYAIDRNRIYRNSIEHRKLSDPRQQIAYEEYLLEDLQGRSPLLVDDGYLILQGKIVQKLHEALCSDYLKD